MKRKRNRRIMAFCYCLMLILLLVPRKAEAAGNIDTEQDVKLTLSYLMENTVIAGAEFSIYQVAAVDKTGELTTTEAFKDYNVNIQGKNDDAWWALASTLEGYVLRDGVKATDTGKTDAQGKVTFPTTETKLPQGLYLVIGQRHTQDGYYYDMTPTMIMLPMENLEKNSWDYQVTAEVKGTKEEVPAATETTTRKVQKVWVDTGYEEKRPDEVQVQLLCNGKVYDTVTLNEDNNWRYEWKNLDATAKWSLTEKKVRRYHVETTQQGKKFTVKNTYYALWDDLMKGEDTTGGTKLPQTGQLWWPIPVLFTLGLLFLLVGLLRRRGISHDQ